MLGKFLLWGGVTATAIAGAYVFLNPSVVSAGGNGNGTNNPKPNNGGGGTVPGTLGGWEFAEWTTTGVAGDVELPTLVVLHDEASGDAEVRKLFEGFKAPARIIVPLGKVGTGQSRSYVDPETANAVQVQKTAVDLQACLFDIVKTRKVAGRLIVVSLGTIQGTLALALGFFAGLVVRQVYALGGLYEPSYVAQAPQAPVRMRLLFQESLSKLAQDLTIESFKLAASRGFDVQLQLGDFDLPISRELAEKWLWPELTSNLGKL